MTERLIEKLDRFGAEAGIKEMTPEIRRFAMLVRNDMLQVWPKRDWVGLTDDEVSKLIDNEIGFNSCCGWETEYTRAVEAKLEEKNAQA
jgi:hypothetical protein